MTAHLSLEDPLELHQALGGLPVRNLGLLDAAVVAPFRAAATVPPEGRTFARAVLQS